VRLQRAQRGGVRSHAREERDVERLERSLARDRRLRERRLDAAHRRPRRARAASEGGGVMTLLHPIWLLLAIPLAITFFVWPPRRRWLRIALFLAILLALAGVAVDLPSRAGTVVVVADRSLSMPRDADALERELTRTLQSKQPPGSKLSVVSFGRDAQLEVAPFAMPPNQPESNMQRGLETALSLIPPDTPGRVVLLSDGRWSGEDPSAA